MPKIHRLDVPLWFVLSELCFGIVTGIHRGWASISITSRFNSQRTIARPDILFSAGDLGTGAVGIPLMVQRRVSSRNNQNLNGNGATPLGGPGVIQGPVEISFSKIGPYLLNTNLAENSESSAMRGRIWGSFDGSTNEPAIFPAGSSIRDWEKAIIRKHSGTNWRIPQ